MEGWKEGGEARREGEPNHVCPSRNRMNVLALFGRQVGKRFPE